MVIRHATSVPTGGPIAVDLELLHRSGNTTSPSREIIQAPAAEQLREVIDDDQVGVETRRLARP